MTVTKLSGRRVGRALGQHRSTRRQVPRGRDDEEQLTDGLIELARRYGRTGIPLADRRLLAIAERRKIAALLRDAGWVVNDKRVERIWRRDGLKVPAKQPKRGWLWLNDGSCVRLRPERANHVWSYDFVEGRTPQRSQVPHAQRQSLRDCADVIDEFAHECLP